jgi:hypothetical protein
LTVGKLKIHVGRAIIRKVGDYHIRRRVAAERNQAVTGQS